MENLEILDLFKTGELTNNRQLFLVAFTLEKSGWLCSHMDKCSEFRVNSIVACNASCVSTEGFAIILSGFVW